MTNAPFAGESMRPFSFSPLASHQRPTAYCLLPPALCLLLSAFCLLPAASARAASLLYQWDFNAPTGNSTTVAPAVGSGGVLTMSQQNDGISPVPPYAINLY